MRAKDFKGRCIKKHLQKADGVVKLYDSIQVKNELIFQKYLVYR